MCNGWAWKNIYSHSCALRSKAIVREGLLSPMAVKCHCCVGILCLLQTSLWLIQGASINDGIIYLVWLLLRLITNGCTISTTFSNSVLVGTTLVFWAGQSFSTQQCPMPQHIHHTWSTSHWIPAMPSPQDIFKKLSLHISTCLQEDHSQLRTSGVQDSQ